ncbi:MAG: DUF2630 family protein [Tepidiformaceae bacterium]
MDDRTILSHISKLVDDERELHGRTETGAGLDQSERQRLEELRVDLDQCWDLLRQRRAARAAGRDPATAAIRDEKTVEGYQQ